MAIEVRTVGDDELVAFRTVICDVFGDDLVNDPDAPRRIGALVPAAQRWGAYDGRALVATAGTFDLAIGVPGGSVDIAGLTMVCVRPTHRRRGILRALISHHLADARARGRAISGLWASEAAIYGRFGYGVAAELDVIEIKHAPGVTFARGPAGPGGPGGPGGHDEPDQLVQVDLQDAVDLLPAIYERATADRPGVLRRTPLWWHERRYLETAAARGGNSRRRHVIARRGGEPVGYLAYRQRMDWASGLPAGQVEIIELIAVDPRATAALWQAALAVDLFPRVSWWNAPVDDPLGLIVGDARHVRRTRYDSLWLRIEDVAAALAARRYPADGALRFAIDGESEAWELVVEGGRGRAAPTSHAAELAFSRPVLGSLYLGGFAASRLARAGVVHGSPAAIATADQLFGSPVAPWCPEIF